MSVRERCSCGAEIETDEPDALEVWTVWRETHVCPEPFREDFAPIGGTSQVKQAPDYTIPEMHIGFRI